MATLRSKATQVSFFFISKCGISLSQIGSIALIDFPRRTAIAFALAVSLGGCAAQNESAPTPASETPASVVDAFSAALRAGDATIVQTLLARDVIIVESGGVERSYNEYASEHLPFDIAFMAGVQFTLQQRDVIASDDMATVISKALVHGQFRNRPINSNSVETMVLRRIDGHWRIVHVHWSSSPIAADG